MTETIGNVILNTDDYHGDVHAEAAERMGALLEIARDYDPSDFDRIVAERKSFPVMEQFSSIRGNLISWYPDLSGARVLEIGSGCGALTGALAEKAASVTCVEADGAACLINALRNRRSDHIRILAGKLSDIEPKLPGDFDIILVSEAKLLSLLKTHLSPGGVVIVSQENRLGLKYFAGCAEEHTGAFFAGIEGYPEGEVRTLSRQELEKCALSAGFPEMTFYYPYPDLRFPMSVYSDRYLPKGGELRSNIMNFDRKRLVLFDESKAWDALLDSGLFPQFANAFLVVLGCGDTKASEETILFTKFSNERSRRLSIRTDIVSENDGKGGERLFVRKLPAGPDAGLHVQKMEERFRLLGNVCRGTRFRPNEMTMRGDAAVFAYLTGETLESVFDREYLSEPETLEKALLAFLNEIGKTGTEVFSPTESFRNVFGNTVLPDGLQAAPASDIDMVLNNILVGEDGSWNIIDYEWTFDFPVPVRFLEWRVLHYYIEGNTKRFFLREAGLFEKAGISRQEEDAFLEMEKAFQKYIEGERVPLRELYSSVSEGAVDLPAILKRMEGREDGGTGKLYPGRGGVFTEENAVEVPLEADGRLVFNREISGCTELRIDPAEHACSVTIEELMTELGPVDPADVQTNGVRLDLRRWLFDTGDPWLIAGGWPEDARFLYGRIKVMLLDTDSAEFMRKELDARDRKILALTGADRRKEDLLEWRGAFTKQLMKTKALRAYRKLRVKTGKQDPYSSLRPLLPSDPDGILYCIDHMSHRKDAFFLRGWCFDREYDRVRVFVVNSKDREIDAEITRYRRPDVARQFGLPEEKETGFSVRIEYGAVKDPPLYLEVEDARGYTCEKLEIETDPSRREEANARQLRQEGAAHAISGYDDYAAEHRTPDSELKRQSEEKEDPALQFSVVVPLYRTDPQLLDALVDSVLQQTWRNLELILSDGSGDNSPLEEKLAAYEKRDSRVRVLRNKEKLRIAENTNRALDAARGSWIVFADHDDVLTPDALYENASVIRQYPDTELIYSDEDKLFEGGILDQPNFKPDFSPDLLTSVNYICHLVAVKRELLDRAGKLDPSYDGAQDYDFLLRCTEKTDRIRHIPKVLYHWRAADTSTAADPAAKEYAFAAGARAIEAHFARTGIPADVTRLSRAGLYRVRYRVEGDPLVSIVIPNKDHIGDLTRCIRSIEEKAAEGRREYIIVENNSTETETFEGYRALEKQYPHIQVVTYSGSFNYSAINNLGARRAKGEYLLFLNNDTELIAADSIALMTGLCQRPDVGAVGARLFFEDGTIQHAGVVLGYGGIAGHAFREFGPEETGYQHRIILQQDVSAVTAACMLVRRSVFEEIGGFFEGLAVAFNDIDLCMRITEAGYRIVYEPNAQFTHYESKSRGYEDTPEKQARFVNETRIFKERWQDVLTEGDPYYNPNLTLKKPDFTLRESDEYH